MTITSGVQAQLIVATNVEYEQTLATPITVSGGFGLTATVLSVDALQAVLSPLDTTTMQGLLAYSILHDIVNQQLPAPGYW